MDRPLKVMFGRSNERRPGRGIRRGLVCITLVVLGAFSGHASADDEASPAAHFEDCHRQVDDAAEDYSSYLCFYLAARKFPRAEHPEVWETAAEQLRTLRSSGANLGLTSLILGFLAMGNDDPAAVTHLVAAATELQRQGDTLNEVKARGNAHKVLSRLGRPAEAGEQVRLARRSAEGSDDPEALARVLVLSALHRSSTGGDLGRAYIDLKRALVLDVPADNHRLRLTILFELGRLAVDLGQWADAISIYERRLQLMQELGEHPGAAATALNLAMAHQAQLELRPDPDALAALEERNRFALALAERDHNLPTVAQSHRVIAEGLMSTRPEEAGQHLATCIRIAGEIGDVDIESSCYSAEGRRLLPTDPEGALVASRKALDLARHNSKPLYEAFGWRALMRAAWATQPRPEAMETCRQGLAAIESLRQAQQDPLSRAQLLDNWATDLAWLVGRLLDDPAPDLPEAFAVIERLRSRVLLEHMASPSTVREEDAGRQEVRQHIAAVQRKLLNPQLNDGVRASLLDELDRWELEERSMGRGTAAPRNAIEFVDLERVQDSLQPGDVLLSFQVGLNTDFFGQPAGGSWVIATTAEGSRHHAIADASALEPAVSVFLGLLQRRDGSEAESAVQLYEMVLGDALKGLPTAIERLILVPDGTLHHLPFAALRDGKGEATLGERFEIVLAPSATLWHRWRNEEIEPPERSLLALADPQLPNDPETPHATRNAVLLNGLHLGPLPHARREGKAILRHLGGDLLTGEDASERFIKAQDLARFGVLHFASHAVADAVHAERSSLVLTPGDLAEDGLLRAPEIADLDLPGRLVVLSACQTTAGQLLKTEGIFSLARAFFEARAHGVVGSRWPLRDDEAAFFFDRFYRHLAAGQTSAGALRQARRDAVEKGLPAAAWAGVSLLGNGNLGVTPEATLITNSTWFWFLVLAPLCLLGVSTWRRLRPRHSG